MIARLSLPAALVFALSAPAIAADLDLTRAVVVAPPGLTGPAAKAVQMLVEEVDARAMVRWDRAEKWPAGGTPVVVVGPGDDVRKLLAARGVQVSAPAQAKSEGYQIGVAGGVVWVAGNDARGVLFGVGRLLRELRLDRLKVTLPADFKEDSAPTTPLRGHQIGYRPKTNSYDGWTVAMWEQYVRDLAVFGCNAVELIPPRSDDAADSPLFPLPPLRMMAEVSRIADSYGLDVWVWYPAMDKDYADPKTVEFALKEWAEVFKAVPRIDAVFVPGGDPGHTRPKVLFDLLGEQAANLKRFHPKATMWMSPQSFTGPWMDEFHELVRQNPPWLAGVVYGPQTRVSLPKLRAALPPKVQIRDYPDITHSRQCQYPVPDWDAAFAVTEGREVCNPRPVQTARLFHYGRANTFGFITYSEGCHDDVNKMVWSALGWDEKADVKEVLRQYGRYFVGPALGDRFADGLSALEKNWEGPVLDNAGIDETLKHFQALERDAGPREKLNWRFQQALYRAYYDAYVRTRLRHETAARDAAVVRLRAAKTAGALKAIADAEAILDRAAKEPAAPELRARMNELAEALFQSIRAQLGVKKYHGMAGRGNSLDSADAPLTDAAWLRAEMTAAAKLPDEAARVARLAAAVTRTDPGPGGFYDDFGDPRRQPHLVRGPGWEKDPGFDASPQCAFSLRGGASPKAWWHYAETHYETPLRAEYAGLDPKAAYRVRVVYGQQEGRKVRLTAGDGHEVHAFLSKPFEPVEFDVPKQATAGGTLVLTWTPEPGAGGPGRGCQVCEVWVIKTPAAAPHGRVVLEDPLTGATRGRRTGGKFVDGGGWTAAGEDDRIVWELPDFIGDGCLEVEVRNFDPARQAVARKNNILGLWETLWESGGMKDKPNMDNINVRVGQNYKQMKLELHTHGFAQKEKPVEPLKDGFDPKHTYKFKAEWVKGTVRFFLDGEKFYEWDSPKDDPMDRFKFVHVGSDPQFKGATPGPVFANLRVTAYDPPPDIRDVAYPSKLLKQDVPIKVYLPPGYAAGTDRYPVVYNLHGGGGSPERQWDRTREALTAAMGDKKVRPMIYVFVNGLGNTEFVNTADGKPIERSIVEELIPFIDAKYRTVAAKHGRAIDGFSMGGWGCLSVAFRHPDLFAAVVSYGGALAIGPDGRNYRDAAHHAEHDPNALARAKAAAIRDGLRVRVVCGEDDEKWYPGNVRFKDILAGQKIPCDWVPVAGVAHDTKGLYDRVGVESLKFIERAFDAAAQEKKDGIADRTFRSKLNDRDVTIKVYTPPGYHAGTDRYPVVYNLHGAGGGSPERQWDRVKKTLTEAMEDKKVRPMIYVFVDGLGDTFFIDYATGSPKVEGMIVQELLPWVDENYRTIAGRHGRAVDGFSMGGFGCLMLAFRHPDKFCAVVSYGAALIDPATDTPKKDDKKDAPAKKDDRAGRWGDKAYADKYNPRALAKTNADKIRDGVRVRVVCGDKDGLYDRNVTFKDLLGELKIPCEWVPVAGVAHDTKGLYDRVGVESLRFIEKAFDAAARTADK